MISLYTVLTLSYILFMNFLNNLFNVCVDSVNIPKLARKSTLISMESKTLSIFFDVYNSLISPVSSLLEKIASNINLI